MEPPRPVTWSLRSSKVTEAPFSAADSAQHSPEKPAPMITISDSTVDVISLSGMGSGAISKV